MSEKNNTEIWVAEVREVIEWKLIKLKDRTPSTVYVLQCLETSRFKIGITQNLTQRIKEIQSACATKLMLMLAFPTIGQDVERCLHRKFESYRLHGEWFAIPNSETGLIQELQRQHECRMNPISDENMDQLLDHPCYKDVATPKPIREFWKLYGDRAYDLMISKYPNENS